MRVPNRLTKDEVRKAVAKCLKELPGESPEHEESYTLTVSELVQLVQSTNITIWTNSRKKKGQR